MSDSLTLKLPDTVHGSKFVPAQSTPIQVQMSYEYQPHTLETRITAAGIHEGKGSALSVTTDLDQFTPDQLWGLVHWLANCVLTDLGGKLV